MTTREHSGTTENKRRQSREPRSLALGHPVDSRDYGVGIQVLKDLGLDKVRLLTNNPKKTDAFIYGGFDLQVVDQVPIVLPIHEHNAKYMTTKRDKMGHRLP